MARRNSLMINKTLYQIGVLTLITSMMWTLVAVIQAINKAPAKIEVGQKLLEPITILVDKSTIESLSKRQKIDLNFTPVDSATASPSATIEVGGQ